MGEELDVSICIGTFGHPSWVHLAEERAIPSAEAQGVPVIHRHGRTLAVARNEALALVDTEWVIHLDADDELAEDYIKAMATGLADIRAPARQGFKHGQRYGPCEVPRVWSHGHECVGECLRYGNFIVIGACARTELVRGIGWEEFGWSEDYALWARCWKAGATIESVPEAVYLAHMTGRGRNRVRRDQGLYWHREIEKAVWPDEPSVL